MLIEIVAHCFKLDKGNLNNWSSRSPKCSDMVLKRLKVSGF